MNPVTDLVHWELEKESGARIQEPGGAVGGYSTRWVSGTSEGERSEVKGERFASVALDVQTHLPLFGFIRGCFCLASSELEIWQHSLQRNVLLAVGMLLR